MERNPVSASPILGNLDAIRFWRQNSTHRNSPASDTMENTVFMRLRKLAAPMM